MRRVGVRRRWEPVWGGRSEAEAGIVAGGLDADGIATRITGSPGFRGPGMHQEGGWAIFVREGEAARARALLDERGEGHKPAPGLRWPDRREFPAPRAAHGARPAGARGLGPRVGDREADLNYFLCSVKTGDSPSPAASLCLFGPSRFQGRQRARYWRLAPRASRLAPRPPRLIDWRSANTRPS